MSHATPTLIITVSLRDHEWQISDLRGAWRPMSDAGQWMEIADALSDADNMIHEIVAVTQGVVRGHSEPSPS